METETYTDFCPLSRGTEVFATRWTPLILRNLLLGCRTFTEIHDGLPGISRTLLTQRLRLLEHHGVLERRPRADGRGAEYVLTPSGDALAPVVDALGRWGEQWLEMAPRDYDAGTLLWGLSKRLTVDDLPEERVVIRFEVSDPGQRYWLLVDRPRIEVCRRPPGVGEDAVVRASARWLVDWQTGRARLHEALGAGLVAIDGPPSIARRLAAWDAACTYAEVDRKAAGG